MNKKTQDMESIGGAAFFYKGTIMDKRFRAGAALAATLFSGLAYFASAIPPSAAAPPEIFKPLRTDMPPVLDGKLDDPVWRKAPSVSNFKTFIPDFGREPSEKTVAFMA